MKCLSLLVVAVLAFGSTADAGTFISNSHNKANAIPEKYIVVLKDSNAVNSFEPKFNQLSHRIQNGRNGGKAPKINHRFKAIPGFTVEGDRATLDELLKLDEVDYIEQDSIVSIVGTQQSPPSWGLPRVSQRGRVAQGTSYKYANSAGAGVTAYVVDTGINTAHVDFGGRAKMGNNFIQGSPNTDENGHGTHVAGTIGGNTYGVAKKVNLVGVKVLNRQGSGSTSGIVAALDWIVSVNKGKKAVVNMSLGGGSSRALNDAVGRLFRANIPVIVAAGNDENVNACSGSPSGAPQALAVGASDVNDNIATFSSFGKCVKIFGPGVQITSAWIGSKTARNTISGTSMATPHVVGVAALYMGAGKANGAAQVYTTLQSTATKNAVKGRLRGEANLLVFNGGGK
ncbi:cuticle-degrading serine protease [Linnemannia elongata AG-77]|uniref:Cuticle-degrading serine protease n=1 Tax=Linnemannia elongata AG-77 TaxID=1314771 RepID=A0A197KCU5_9FUNG|nr:cuticle-degrading serine protease [Linnemannia elongata AG-77]